MLKDGFCAPIRTQSCRRAKAEGFTLVEVMVVIVLAAILMALALPSFSGLMERFRVEGVAAALTASMIHARSEAVRRGQTVTIQPREGCSGKDWSCGWDTVAGKDATQETLRRQDPDSRVTVIKSSAGSLTFDAMGHSSLAGFGVHPVGNDASPNAVALCVSTGGRIQRKKGVVKCAQP
jgi:type IV fimbrial biogenesis protein FimT